jgi:hypothetical protein
MSLGFTINISEPLWIGTASLESVGDVVTSYTHAIDVAGGYATCAFNIGGSRDEAEDWLYSRIGAHVEVHNSSGVKVWEGFVNEVSITLGTLAITRGPMTAIANSVYVKYQTPAYYFPGAGLSIGGDQFITGPDDDATSIALYGTREKILSGGTASDNEADNISNTFLNENAYPAISQDVSIGGAGGNVSINIKCSGYMNLLDYVPANIGAGVGEMNLSTKLEETLAKDPDDIFSTNYDFVESNTEQVQVYYEEDQTALDIIKGLVSLGAGPSGYERTIWGIYDDLTLHYESIPTDYEYTYSIGDVAQIITDGSNSIVEPWDIKPGKFMLVSDFLVGRIIPATLREDPRMLFIESVTYTAPDTLKLQGGRVDTINQKLAKLNLGAL